jgi:integrase
MTSNEVHFDIPLTPIEDLALSRGCRIRQVRSNSRLDQMTRFYPPKTAAGRRTVPISAWLAEVLREHRARSGGVGLVFPSAAGAPLNKANVRKRVWIPLLTRAKVPYRDLYSLRWTFVSLARASGEVPFNVSRIIGHARSTIVDTIYAHTVPRREAQGGHNQLI